MFCCRLERRFNLKMYLQDGYIHIETKDISLGNDGNIKKKKIYGHNFVALIGKDNFKRKGDAVLDILKILPKENIDPFYTLRGAVAEQLVHRSYVKKGHKYEIWDAKAINYDNFKDVSEIFGGLMDGLCDDNIVVEVKSKSMDKYKEITENGVESEELQGEYYAVLKGTENVNLEWVFFTKQQEEELKTTGKITQWIGCLNFQKCIKVDSQKIIEYMHQAVDYLNNCINEMKIPATDVSDKVFNTLVNERGLTFNDGARK